MCWLIVRHRDTRIFTYVMPKVGSRTLTWLWWIHQHPKCISNVHEPVGSRCLYRASAALSDVKKALLSDRLIKSTTPRTRLTKKNFRDLQDLKQELCRFQMAEWLGCWTCDQQVAGLNPSCPAVEYNPGQVNTRVPLSSSSIIWYQPMDSNALRLGM